MKKHILQVGLAIIALGAAFFGARYWQRNYLTGISMTQIPVPKADIPPYTVLSADMFSLQEVPRALTDQGAYILSNEQLIDSISVETLLAGLPVPKRMAVLPQQFRLADPSREVVSIPAEAVSSAGGQIHIGETVNIYCLEPAPKQDQADQSLPAPKPEVYLIATVPVVAILADNGQPLSLSSNANNQVSTDSIYQPQPMKILVVAAPHQTVQDILDAVAMVKLGGSLLWVTLATP